jgi:quercetin dioxygenase-like cupin family protein
MLSALLAAYALAATVTVHPAASQNVYAQKGTEVRMWVEDAEGAYAGTLRFEPGTAVAAHRHETSEELLVLTAGQGEMTLDGKTVTVKAGDAIHIPKQTLHAFKATGGVPVEAVQIYAPKGPEDRFKAWPRK